MTRYQSKDDLPLEQSRKLVPPQALTNGHNLPNLKDPRLAGWEFKIVRANGDLFRNPIIFKRLCDEEAQAGWILLEKLDDHRVRFKRPIALREVIKPELLSFDPYRCHYGSSSNLITWLGTLVALIFTLLPAYLGYVLVSTTLLNSKSPESSSSPLPTSLPSLKAPDFPDKP